MRTPSFFRKTHLKWMAERIHTKEPSATVLEGEPRSGVLASLGDDVPQA